MNGGCPGCGKKIHHLTVLRTKAGDPVVVQVHHSKGGGHGTTFCTLVGR